MTANDARQVAKENFECLSGKLAATVARIEALEASIAPFKDAKGAVVTFNRDRQKGPICPRGWTYFEAAGGRFVVGAGEHDDNLRIYPSFAENERLAIGGEEMHLLTLAEMPAHTHANGNHIFLLQSDGNRTIGNAGDFTRGEPNLHTVGRILSEGGNQPHNNLPPFISLYFCIKD